MSYQKDVENFMTAGEQPVKTELSLKGDQQNLYMNLITEEYKETIEAFENNDSSPVSIDVDINGQNRNYNPTVGPFERLKKGKNRIKIFIFNH